jgi:hypothetical protein
MLGLLTSAQILLFTGATDMRKGFDGLIALVMASGENVYSGKLYVFVSGRRNGVTLCTPLFSQTGGESSNLRDIAAMSSVGVRAPA